MIIVGYRYLRKKALVYTVYGTLSAVILDLVWQRFYIPANIHEPISLLPVSWLAGSLGVCGSGIVYRFRGTTGDRCHSSDLGKKKDPDGKKLLALDAVVLTLSLSYLDLRQMMYTLT